MAESYRARWVNHKHWTKSQIASVDAIIPALLKGGSSALESTSVKCSLVSGGGYIDINNLDVYCGDTQVFVQGYDRWLILSAFG
jgi:hypothetical protein